MHQQASVSSSQRCSLPEIGRSRQEQHLLQKLSSFKKQVNQAEKIMELRKCEQDMEIKGLEASLKILRDQIASWELNEKRGKFLQKASYLVKDLIEQKKKARETFEKVDEISEGARHSLTIGKNSAAVLEKYHKLRMGVEHEKEQLRPQMLSAKHLDKILKSKAKEEKKRFIQLRGKSTKADPPTRFRRVRKENVTFDVVENAAKALEESNRQRRAEATTAEESDEAMQEVKRNEEQDQSDDRTPLTTRSGRTLTLPKAKMRVKREPKVAPAPKRRKDTIHGRKVESVKITQANMVPGKVKEVARQLKNSITTRSTREMLALELAISDSEDEATTAQLEAITNSILGVKPK